MALVAGLLLSRYLGGHDLALLLLPIALAMNYAVAHPEQMRARAAGIVSLVLLIPSLYLTLISHTHLDLLAAGMLVFLILLDCLGTPATCETHAPIPESVVR